MSVQERAIRKRLVERGKELFTDLAEEADPLNLEKPADLDEVQHQEATSLVHPLKHHPHAFVIACILDRQIYADRAWLIPYRLSRRIGSPVEPRFDFHTLLELSEDEIQAHMKGTDSKDIPSLHRFPEKMGGYVHAAIQLMADKYDGRAEKSGPVAHPVQDWSTGF